jgi:hypothetical protein
MVTIEFRPEEMRAVALDQGKVIGECTVTASGRIWLLTHTEVDKASPGSWWTASSKPQDSRALRFILCATTPRSASHAIATTTTSRHKKTSI